MRLPPETHSIYEFQTFDVYVDFSKPHEAQKHFHDLTMQVEAKCPVANAFGVNGVGEALVWTAFHKDRKIQFKTKGEKHSATKVKTIADVDVEHFAKVQEFVCAAMTDARLGQGLEYLREQELDFDIRNIGVFLKWAVGDVLTEEADTIEGSGLDEKVVKKDLSRFAADWYKRKVGLTNA